MFRSRNRHVFKPTAYGARRRRRVPRWLVLMLSGIVLGAGGLLFLQKSYGPQRLTVEQSEQLQYDLNSANMEKQRLTSELAQQGRELAQVTQDLDERTRELATARDRLDHIDEDIQMLADAVAPDPRGTSPGIRAARFQNLDGELGYQILVMQDRDKIKPFKGTVELVVSGRYSSGANAHVDLDPFDIELEHYTQVSGQLPLPDHFTARQVTIKIMAEGETKVTATRTIIVSRG